MRPVTDNLDTVARAPVARLIVARNGSWTLKVKAEDSSSKAIHSLHDPEAESRSIVQAFQCDGRSLVVVLGLGLGYHVAGLLERFGSAEIVVVEAHRGIFNLQNSFGPRLGETVHYLVGLPTDEALREISRLHLRSGMKPIVGQDLLERHGIHGVRGGCLPAFGNR
jgi:hypothetical protein